MKNKNILYLFAGLTLLGSSCKKQLDLENPNAPTEISIETPRAAMSNIVTGELGRLSGMLTQQMSYGAGDNSYQTLYENYQVTNGDYKYVYENLYTKVLNNCEFLNSSEADLLQGLAYVYLNDYFTNPYKLGEGQQALTESDIFSLLDPIILGGGSLSGAASLAKAKYYLSQEDYANALPLVASFMESDNYEYTTLGNINNNNNWALFALYRPEYIAADPFSKSLFETTDDSLRYKESFGYLSSEYISDVVQIDANHILGFANALQTVEILGYLEAKFIEAECIVRASGDATVALAAAITYNYNKLGLDVSKAPSYTNPTLDEVKTEKFKAMLGHPTIMVDFRRWKNDPTPFIPGFVEKVPGAFPDKIDFVVQ